VLADDRPTVGELLADGDAVSVETFYEASRSQRLAMVRWPPPQLRRRCQASRPLHRARGLLDHD
jgi:hypothetical protein